MVIRYLIEKEFLQIRRNAILPRLFVMLPLVLLIVVPFAANQEIKNLKFCVVDNDHSSFSRRLVQKIDASAYFSLADYCGCHSAAMRSIDGGCADVAVEIGHDFEQNLVKTGVADINVEANAVNGMKGMLAQAYMLQIIADYAAQLGEEHGIDASGVSLAGADVRPRFLYNGQLDYKMFMIPAVMAMLLTLLIGFLPALNIVGEKESGTIEQINVTPVGRFSFIFSKLIPYWLIGLFMLAWSVFLAWLIYGMLPAGNILLLFLYATLFLLIVSSLGLIVSNYSSTMQQAALLMFFFLVIFILMSGMLTPVSAMPEWAQLITYVNPLRYFIEVLRALYLKGSGFADLQMQFFAMLAYAAVSWTWAICSYKKSA